jgi:hypothetical protein
MKCEVLTIFFDYNEQKIAVITSAKWHTIGDPLFERCPKELWGNI